MYFGVITIFSNKKVTKSIKRMLNDIAFANKILNNIIVINTKNSCRVWPYRINNILSSMKTK